LKAALGGTRYADYQRATDNSFEQISAIVERHGLPAAKALEVYEMQHQADAQAQQLRSDASRTAEERSALLVAIRNETERSMSAVLGAAAFATFRDRAGDGWFHILSAPPK